MKNLTHFPDDDPRSKTLAARMADPDREARRNAIPETDFDTLPLKALAEKHDLPDLDPIETASVIGPRLEAKVKRAREEDERKAAASNRNPLKLAPGTNNPVRTQDIGREQSTPAPSVLAGGLPNPGANLSAGTVETAPRPGKGANAPGRRPGGASGGRPGGRAAGSTAPPPPAAQGAPTPPPPGGLTTARVIEQGIHLLETLTGQNRETLAARGRDTLEWTNTLFGPTPGDVDVELHSKRVLTEPLPSSRTVTTGSSQVAQAATGTASSSAIVDVPVQVIGGARDAIQETIESLEELSEILSIIDPNVRVATSLRREFLKNLGDSDGIMNLPSVRGAKTDVGAVTRGVSQFIISFIPTLRLVKGVAAGAKGGTAIRGALAGALADATAFDPHEKRLSDLIQQYPALRNPIAAYLSADPGDSRAEGRFKNAVEGLVAGEIAPMFVASVRIVRSSRKQRSQSTSATLRDRLSSKRFRKWAKRVLDPGYRGANEVVAIGKLSKPVRRFLASKGLELRELAITISDGRLRRMTREVKRLRQQAVPEDQILSIPKHLQKPEAILWDNTSETPRLLYVFNVPKNERKGKIVVHVDFRESLRESGLTRKIWSNSIRSAGLVKPEKLRDENTYELVFGSVKQ